MNRYHPIANPGRDLTINGTPIRHLYIDDRIWVHNADLAEAIGALAKGSLLIGVSAKWKRKWREDLGGGKATRAVTYLVAEGLLQRSMSMKRDSDSYPRLRDAIDQISTLEAERRTQHAEALTTAAHGADPKDEPTLPITLAKPPALAQLDRYTKKLHAKQTNLNRELNLTRAAVDEVRDDLMWFGRLLIGVSASAILAYIILFLIVIVR